MGAPSRVLWSTPKFFAIALVLDFAIMFVLNGILNEVLHLGVSAGAIGVAPAFATVLLLPRWRVYAERVAGKAGKKA
jgi:hypothetical protein